MMNTSFSAPRKIGVAFVPGSLRNRNPSPPVPEIRTVIPTLKSAPGSGGTPSGGVPFCSSTTTAVGVSKIGGGGIIVTIGVTKEYTGFRGDNRNQRVTDIPKQIKPIIIPAIREEIFLFMSDHKKEESHSQNQIHSQQS